MGCWAPRTFAGICPDRYGQANVGNEEHDGMGVAFTSGHHKWPLTLGPWRIGSYGILRIRETDLEEMPALCRAIDGLVEVIAPRLCHMTSKSLPNPCLTPGDA